MASPVTGSDFTLYTQLVGVCEKLTYLMGSMEKVKALVDYMWDEDGEATQALLSLGLPPPGTIFAYWTTTTDWTTAKAEVERLGRTDADVASGTGPLYRICDGTNSTPDLRARTIVGASNTSTPTLAAGLTQRAMNAIGAPRRTLSWPTRSGPTSTRSLAIRSSRTWRPLRVLAAGSREWTWPR